MSIILIIPPKFLRFFMPHFNPTPCIICDLDGTLSDCRARLHFVKEKNWKEFYANLGSDMVIEPVARLLDAIKLDYPIILCSGRPEDYRGATESWLKDNRIPYNGLYMRAKGDFRQDAIIKMELLEQIREDGYEPFIVIDDRQQVVDAWRRAGLTVLQHGFLANSPVRGEGGEAAQDGPILSLMVGPSGAGKSYFLRSPEAAKYKIHLHQIISSDAIRIDLCSNFLDQSKNDEVFAIAHTLIRARLEAGLPTVFDATNLRKKDRLAVADLSPGLKRYFIINRPMPEKYRDGGWRNELGFDLIGKHEMTFNSQLKDILAGDNRSDVEVIDLRGRV